MYLRLCLFAALCAPFSPTPALAAAPALTIEEARAFSEQVGQWQQARDLRSLQALREGSVMNIMLLKRDPEVRLRLAGEQLRAFMERALQQDAGDDEDNSPPSGPARCEFEATAEGKVIETCSQPSADLKTPVWSRTIFARDDKGPYFVWMLLTDTQRLLQAPRGETPTAPVTPAPDNDEFDNHKA